MAEPIKHKLGLFGHPVAHSQSPLIQADFAQQFGIGITYDLINTQAHELPSRFNQWIKDALGCNITVPHKNNIIPLLDHYTQRAHLAQAVNTVFWRDGELWGDNTDGDGLVIDLKLKSITLKDAQVLVIGAGGATQGIIPSLQNQGVAKIDIKNRNHNKARFLAEQYDHCFVPDDKAPSRYDLIIHATSMGHQGLCPKLNSHWFHHNSIAYDLSYGTAAEPFLNAAKKMGASATYDGLGMLYGQAALAFEIWFGKKPTINLP